MSRRRLRLGLIVNPIAGMGGAVGLKGTDNVLSQAVGRGAVPRAGQRTLQALESLVPMAGDLVILTCAGPMGADIVPGCFASDIIYSCAGTVTRGADTRGAVREIMARRPDLILFAGGDGTARDVCSAAGQAVPVLGIPAGVKIHSPVYALTPRHAGDLALKYLKGRGHRLKPAEVMDLDEDAYRRGRVAVRLFGYLNIPDDSAHTQSRKTGTPVSETAAQQLIALAVIDRMLPDTLYIIGPGTTPMAIMEKLGLEGTLIGVDLLFNRKMLLQDAARDDILAALERSPGKVVVTPVGGQGFVFGRGNQQISSDVLSLLGKEDILMVATKEKIFSLRGRPLMADTGDPGVDSRISGYYRVITGYGEEVVYPVRSY